MSSFPFAVMLEVGAQNINLHVEFLPYQRKENFRQSDWDFGKLIWSSWDFMQCLQNGKHCTERHSQGQLQVFYRGQPVFVLAVQVLVCLHHFCKEISLLREPGSIFMQVMCLQPVFNVHCFHLDLFLTCENEQ